MKRTYNSLLIILLATSLASGKLAAAERRGGGHPSGGGGHGGGRPSGGGGHPSAARQYTARTPSMSRADYRPSQAQVRPANPQGGQQRFSSGSMSKNQIQQYLQTSRPQIAHRGNPTQNQQNFKNNFGSQRQNNIQAAQRTQNQININHPGHNEWFNGHFFDEHHHHPTYYHPGVNWWRGARWGAASGWLNWGWGYPVYYEDNGDYVDLPPDIDTGYVEQEQNISPEIPVQGDWLPLGVFTAGQNTMQAAYSNMFVQLAMDRQGDIAGTYYNAGTDETHDLEGSVDRQTQVVVWKVADNPDSPLMITGLYNLTQPVAPIKVQFPDGSVQDWVLVSVQQ